MSVKRMTTVVMLASSAIALRMAFGAFPNIKPITALFLVSILYMETLDAVLVMSLTMIGSSLYFGVSVVVLWQLISFALIMLVWRYLVFPMTRRLRQAIVVQSGLAFLLVFLYGFAISIPTAWQFGANVILYWLNGLSFDFLHAVSTCLFYPIMYHIFRRFYHEKNHF